jgi:serine/threonine protein kinase
MIFSFSFSFFFHWQCCAFTLIFLHVNFVSRLAKSFICNLLQLDPEDRMTAGEAMDHNWFLPTPTLSNSGKSTSRANPRGNDHETEKTKVCREDGSGWEKLFRRFLLLFFFDRNSSSLTFRCARR